ncbi:hypothetical protein [Aquincola sp. J276]|uniref:hypothetical protein n=1 Tax=Aquincola sp. J276 TaxID=2898432 RepID=UPI0021517226|nr:hypothetical protein [Aquincola sp. J276]MCR5864187.1 hypothetical protein [Aquincola sp. J276]
MAKKIDRSRIEAGRFDLPKKLAFLLEDKVDFHSIAERDGEWTVEMPASALQKLLRSKAQLKALKAEHKLATGGHAEALAAVEAEHGGTRAALSKAEQRIRALEKKLAAATATAPMPAADASVAKAGKPGRGTGGRKAVPSVTYPHADAGVDAQAGAPLQAQAEAPAAEPPPVALATAVDAMQEPTAPAGEDGDNDGAAPSLQAG